MILNRIFGFVTFAIAHPEQLNKRKLVCRERLENGETPRLLPVLPGFKTMLLKTAIRTRFVFDRICNWPNFVTLGSDRFMKLGMLDKQSQSTSPLMPVGHCQLNTLDGSAAVRVSSRSEH